MTKPTSIVLWEGKSKFDRAPIVVILNGLTRRSANPKTGAVLQTYILRADVSPTEATRRRLTRSICGSCPLQVNGGCYVSPLMGPNPVWHSYRRGNVPHIDDYPLPDISDHGVRFGTYGDPAACPVSIWRMLAKRARYHMGYTHSWHKRQGATLRGLCQASVEGMAEAQAAWRDGWATFRIVDGPIGRTTLERPCTAQTRGVTCADCRLCNGTRNVQVRLHGAPAALASYRKTH